MSELAALSAAIRESLALQALDPANDWREITCPTKRADELGAVRRHLARWSPSRQVLSCAWCRFLGSRHEVLAEVDSLVSAWDHANDGLREAGETEKRKRLRTVAFHLLRRNVDSALAVELVRTLNAATATPLHRAIVDDEISAAARSLAAETAA